MALSIKAEDILAYFSNNVCPFCANYLDDESIQSYHVYYIKTYKDHYKESSCCCFSCRIFKLLLEVIVARREDPHVFV